MNHREQLAAAKRRLQAMIDSVFGGQVLRDFVPPGKKIAVVLGGERPAEAFLRAVVDSGGFPAFLAVAVDDTSDPTLLVVEPAGRPGGMQVCRPGDVRHVTFIPAMLGAPDDQVAPETVADVIAAIREAHGGDDTTG